MPEIDLVRRARTLAVGSIGGRDLRPASLPVLLRGHRVLFIRYAARPIIGTLNPPMSRPVIVELPAPGRVEVDGMLVVANSDGSVTSISAAQGPHQVEVGFLPGFPDLSSLPRGNSASGDGRSGLRMYPSRVVPTARRARVIASPSSWTLPSAGGRTGCHRVFSSSPVWCPCFAPGRPPTDGGVLSNSARLSASLLARIWERRPRPPGAPVTTRPCGGDHWLAAACRHRRNPRVEALVNHKARSRPAAR